MKRAVAFMLLLFTLTHTVSHATDAVSASVTADNGIYSYLLIGFDESEENTDALVIMSYNSRTNGLGVIQIPRDTYYKSKNSAKINRLYASYLSEGREKTEALELLTSDVSSAMGIKLRGYASFTLEAFRRIIDAVGGVRLELSEAMASRFNSLGMGLQFSEGTNHLSGEDALYFVRFRSGYALSDITRLDAQKIFLRAMISAVRSGMKPSVAFKLISCCGDGLKTNIGIGEILKLMVKNYSRIKDIKYSFFTLPGATVKNSDGIWYYSACKSACYDSFLSLGIASAEFDKNALMLYLLNEDFCNIYNSKEIKTRILSEEDLGDLVFY